MSCHCQKHQILRHTLPHPDPQQYQALWSYAGTAVRPATKYHRSYYDYKFEHSPNDVLCRLYGNCSPSKTPLCINNGLATCMPGSSFSYCNTGVPLCNQQYVGTMWKDDFN